LLLLFIQEEDFNSDMNGFTLEVAEELSSTLNSGISLANELEVYEPECQGLFNRDTGLVGFNRDVNRAIAERVKFCHSFLVMQSAFEAADFDHLQWAVLQAINHLDNIRKTVNLSEPVDDAFDPIGNRKLFSFIPPIYPVNIESSLEQFGSMLRQFDAFFDMMRSKPKHQILVFVFYKGFS
jgi:hypothetical protein